MDPRLALNANEAPFTDDGDPAIRLLDTAEAAGLELAAFPFTAEHFLVHRDRGSLAAVARAQDRQHPLYGWAIDHHEPHFGGVTGARERHAALTSQFRAEVRPPVARRLSASLREVTKRQ